jgi:3-hydroxybutyrate dehydrogenase
MVTGTPVDLTPDDEGPGVAFAADLTTREGNRAAVQAALERFGRTDAIVPNADSQHVSPVGAFDEDHWAALLAVCS